MREAKISEEVIDKVTLHTIGEMAGREKDRLWPALQAATVLFGGPLNPLYLITRELSKEFGPKVETDKPLLVKAAKLSALLLSTAIAIPFLPISTVLITAGTALIGLPLATRFYSQFRAAMHGVPTRAREEKTVAIMESALKNIPENAENKGTIAQDIYANVQKSLWGSDKQMLENASKKAAEKNSDLVKALEKVQRGTGARVLDFVLGWNIGGGKKTVSQNLRAALSSPKTRKHSDKPSKSWRERIRESRAPNFIKKIF